MIDTVDGRVLGRVRGRHDALDDKSTTRFVDLVAKPRTGPCTGSCVRLREIDTCNQSLLGTQLRHQTPKTKL